MTPVELLKSLARKVRAPQRPLDFPDSISLEMSYACNLRCVMCPRHFEGAPQGMLSLEMFRERILPVLPRFRYVHLTGWGEPLMHPRFAEVVRLSKEAGCHVCFTTNGLLLKPPLTERILEAAIDVVNISIDASTGPTYERVRGKGTFQRVLDRAAEFNALRQNARTKPIFNWAFLMMKSNLDELPGAVVLAGKAGFDKIYAKHLDSAISREGLADALFDTGIAPPLTPKEDAWLDEVTARAAKTAQEVGIEFEVFPRRAVFEGTCFARPLRNIFVDWQGYVSPCCYLNRLDTRPYMTERPKDDGILGTIERVSLLDLLSGEKYEQFRRKWARGGVPEPCKGCLLERRMHVRP